MQSSTTIYIIILTRSYTVIFYMLKDSYQFSFQSFVINHKEIWEVFLSTVHNLKLYNEFQSLSFQICVDWLLQNRGECSKRGNLLEKGTMPSLNCPHKDIRPWIRYRSPYLDKGSELGILGQILEVNLLQDQGHNFIIYLQFGSLSGSFSRTNSSKGQRNVSVWEVHKDRVCEKIVMWTKGVSQERKCFLSVIQQMRREGLIARSSKIFTVVF